jgi:hypothetical protein
LDRSTFVECITGRASEALLPAICYNERGDNTQIPYFVLDNSTDYGDQDDHFLFLAGRSTSRSFTYWALISPTDVTGNNVS